MLRNSFLTLIGIFLISICYSQSSKSSLENEKKAILSKINNTNKILSQTRKEKKSSQGELNVISQQIVNRINYLNTLKKETQLLDQEIASIKDVIIGMENDLEYLKDEYADMIYTSYKAHKNFNEVSYMLSSDSYNQLMMRVNYLEQFTEARKKQVNKIEKVKSILEMEKAELNKIYAEKNNSLKNIQEEKTKLDRLRITKYQLIQQLSEQEKELKQQLEDYKKRQKALEKLIQDMIEREREKAKQQQSSNTKEMGLISKNFEANKSRLPWPLQKCFVSKKFGKQAHSVLKGVYVDNMGIGLQGSSNASVRAVFSGVVSTVAKIPGMGNVVMIKHGEYYTVYAKLKNVQVKSGQSVQAKQTIGVIDTNAEGIAELEFQIWKGKDKLNPEPWLAH